MGNFKSEKKRFKDKPTFTNRNTLRLSLQIYNLQMATNGQEYRRKLQKMAEMRRKLQEISGYGRNRPGIV